MRYNVPLPLQGKITLKSISSSSGRRGRRVRFKNWILKQKDERKLNKASSTMNSSGKEVSDPEVDILYVVRNSKLLSRHTTTVRLSKEFNRKPLPTELEGGLEKTWSERVQANPRVFNGSKFRVDSVEGKDDTCTMNLGLTCYKDYLCTNWAANVEEMRNLGMETFGNPQAYMSDPLGVGAFVVTQDKYVLLQQRSAHCSEAVGLWDVPGGHAEPNKIPGFEKKAYQDIDIEKMDPKDVVNEIFDSILLEIKDEVNISVDLLSDPLLMGIGQNTRGGHRPSLEFLVQCQLTFQAVMDLYKTGSQAEASESTSLKGIPLDDVVHLRQRDPDTWESMAPSAKGCVILYCLSHEL